MSATAPPLPTLPSPFRQATPGDAPSLAHMVNMAGDGIPAHFWKQQAGDGQTAQDIGTAIIGREDTSFSYRNCIVYTSDDAPVAMMLGHKLPPATAMPSTTQAPTLIRPILALEKRVPESFYINALAVQPDYRGRGIASDLVQLGFDWARLGGASTVSIIVFEQNQAAMELYRKLGFAPQARRAAVPHPCHPFDGWLVLMTKPVPRASGSRLATKNDSKRS